MTAMNLLQINSSLFGDDGQSSRLANEFVAALLERNPGAARVVRDLVTDPVPHLDADAGVTFRYTGKGPEGLLKGKKAYIFAARGGEYAGSGITDVEFVFAEALAINEERKQACIAAARGALRKLLPETRLAA
jgi:FMN-dependent NADH-azoreductase